MSNPRVGIIDIHKVGNEDAGLADEEKQFLSDLADTLEEHPDIETWEVDAIGTQTLRAARLLFEWPDGLEIEFVYHPEEDEPEVEPTPPPYDTSEFPDVPTAQGDDGRKLSLTVSKNEDTSGHHNRRLGHYTSLCSRVNSWYLVTHDDWNYYNWDDHTTYYAWLSMHPAGPCHDGTYFWLNNHWYCYEPDHDPSVEYAFGNCFGRCGGGCGSSTQFTVDCANHDSCVRFGHGTASWWCFDEFLATIDDWILAPNCY